MFSIVMKTNLARLRKLIREEIIRLDEEWWCEAYDKDLIDDPSFNEKSTYIKDDTKAKIKKWIHSMGLSGKKRSRST